MNTTKYIISKIDNNQYCKNNGHFTRHIRKYGLTYKEYYETYITGYSPLCYCIKPLSFYQDSESYAKSCGNPRCVGKNVSDTIKNWSDSKREKNSTNKKLAARRRTSEEIKNQILKSKKTFKEKYGVEWGSKSNIQKEKTKKIKLEKYGNATYNNSQSSAEKNRNKSIEEQIVINNKRRKTNLEKYGIENTFLMPNVIKKCQQSNAKGKLYTFPSKKSIWIKGYEDTVIDKLLNIYSESDLVIHNWKDIYELPVFQYIDHRRHNLKYYPDIYIPKENKIIEVKGRWWWDGNGDIKYINRLKNNLKKRDAVIQQGYIYEVWLFETRKNFNILKNEKDF